MGEKLKVKIRQCKNAKSQKVFKIFGTKIYFHFITFVLFISNFSQCYLTIKKQKNSVPAPRDPFAILRRTPRGAQLVK